MRQVLIATVRHDDKCGNGHNTFTITGDLYDRDRNNGEPSVTLSTGKHRWLGSCGCLHKKIAKHFPQLAPLIKWHLTSTDEPMHYIENSLYWAGKRGYCDGEPNDPPNLENFRSSAVWPEATAETIAQDEETLTAQLRARLPGLKADFQRAVESLGLVY